MVRPLRIQFPGAWYHVTSRGNERKPIFLDRADRKKFLELLASSVETYGVQIHAYVLMENHYHLLLMTPQGNLNVFMHRLNTAYTVYFNRRHRRSGHLLQGRYKAILIDADSHLAEVSRYLHLNPVRTEEFSKSQISVKRKILSTYRWSSYLGYTSLRKRDLFVTYEMLLSMVGGGDNTVGRIKYGKFVCAGIAEDMNVSYWDNVRGQVLLGPERFVDWIQEKFLKGKIKEEEGQKVFSRYRELLPTFDVKPIAEVVAQRFQVEPDALLRKRSKHPQPRRFLLGVSYDLLAGKRTLAEIGAELGPVGAAALCRNRALLRDELARNRKLAKMYDDILEEMKR